MKNFTLSVIASFIGTTFCFAQSRSVKDVFLHLPMDGNTLDTTSHNHDATLNGPTFTTDRLGKANKALSFDGHNDLLYIANIASQLPTNNYTVSFWLKMQDGDQKSANTFMVMPDDISNRYSSSIYYSHSGTSSHFVDFGDISNRIFYQPDMPDGKWHFFEMIVNNDSILLYKDNTQLSFIVDPDYFSNRTGDLNIGMGKDGYIKGILDDFKITENKVTSSITNLRAQTKVSFSPNPSNCKIFNFNGKNPFEVINVTNSLGQLINYELAENNIKINATAGIYYLKGIDSGNVFVQKLVLNN